MTQAEREAIWTQWKAEHDVKRRLHEASTPEEYAACLQNLTPDQLKAELENVQSSLEMYRSAVHNNEINGYGNDENTSQQRLVVDTLVQKLEMIQARVVPTV